MARRDKDKFLPQIYLCAHQSLTKIQEQHDCAMDVWLEKGKRDEGEKEEKYGEKGREIERGKRKKLEREREKRERMKGERRKKG